MTAHDLLDIASFALPQFCFGYPFVMAWYWMAGGLLYYGFREYAAPPQDHPLALDHWPAISIIVPCYNEAATAEETLTRAAAVDYPDFEIIAVNDGSRDNTAKILDALAARIPNLRVVHLAKNQGKANAMNTGALMARHEILLCIDGDALLDPQALRWAAHYFLRHDIGGFSGNPRIRNRTSILGRLQVGEFSSIIGLIKRSQSTYGRLFTVSGVICAFRKRALADAGWWSSRTVTDDIDITWRVQLAGWRVIYAPNVMVWILMPETLRGLWSQRLRWAEGGAQMMVDFFLPMVRGKAPSMLPLYINFVISVAWSYLMLFALAMGLLWSAGLAPEHFIEGVSFVPQWWGLMLAATYLVQALVSHLIKRRYERNVVSSMFWIIWYPLAFWLISTITTAAAFPRALFRKRNAHTTWVSPDRGVR